MTKTPDPKYHKNNCPIWMTDRIKKLEIVVKKLGDSLDIHEELNIAQPYLDIWKEHGELIEECREYACDDLCEHCGKMTPARVK